MDTLMQSPFHKGERELQERAGVRERMEHFGRRVIRDHFPEQHRQFYQQLPFVLLGYADRNGWPWVSVMAGEQGFMQSPSDKKLLISTSLMAGDPLRSAIGQGLPVGGLGLEPSSRRRNRFSMTVTHASEQELALSVRQSFGNCPQYIQSHSIEFSMPDGRGVTEELTELDAEAVALIESSDTFFVSSQTLHDDQLSAGADVSHRGGKPGFVRVEQHGDECTLTIPDYPGNNHFNTLGNFLLNPRAGLLFWDLQRQDVLMLTGDVKILDEHPLLPFFEGAERFWQFTFRKGVRLRNQLPLQGALGEFSPNTLMTGDWLSAQRASQAQQRRHQYQPYEVVDRIEESEQVVSLYLKPQQGSLPSFQAGQFLTIRIPQLKSSSGDDVVRTYTVSNAPSEGYYRISIKRLVATDTDDEGVVSNYLHDIISVGDVIDAKAPLGMFHWQENSHRDLVMLAAGIGITPMMSMVRHAVREQTRTRSFKNITLVITVRNAREQVFRDEISSLLQAANGYLRVCWCFTQPDSESVRGRDYQVEGRPADGVLQSLLPLADYDFYLCGPGKFMQDMHSNLLGLGVQAKRVFSESFGPSSVLPIDDKEQRPSPTAAASSAVVQLFGDEDESLFELNWQEGDGNLLEFSEHHGVTPVSGCRNGRCGSCAADLVAGDVVYDAGCHPPASGEVLLCCSRPAEGEDLQIRLKSRS